MLLAVDLVAIDDACTLVTVGKDTQIRHLVDQVLD